MDSLQFAECVAKLNTKPL
jgi:hypothetical protein